MSNDANEQISASALDEVNACSVVTNCDCAIPSLRFPQKLWRIVNECRTGAIGWGPTGHTLLLNYKRFQNEYLDCEGSVFKTSNIASFIRQLNLYGFRKVNSHSRDYPTASATTAATLAHLAERDDVHEFIHEHFQVGRLDLLSRICRKTGARKILLEKQPAQQQGSADSQSLPTGMTRLQMCQIALTKALEQATRQYRKEKFLMQLSEENLPKDALKPKYITETTDENIQIIFQDFSELQAIENLPVIDVSTVEHVIKCEDKILWEEVLTLPSDGSINTML